MLRKPLNFRVLGRHHPKHGTRLRRMTREMHHKRCDSGWPGDALSEVSCWALDASGENDCVREQAQSSALVLGNHAHQEELATEGTSCTGRLERALVSVWSCCALLSAESIEPG